MIDDYGMQSPIANGSRIKRLFTSRREEIIEKQYYEIKRLESKYRKLYEDSPVMCRTINTDGIIVDCNRAYLDYLGYSSRDEVIGHSIFDYTPSERMDAMRESFEQWRLTGTVKNREVWFKKKDGTTFPAMINANNLYDDDGNLVSSNTVITDLTDNYKAKMQLEFANEGLRKAQEIKNDFIRIAAHELRTPLQPILLCAELAKKGPGKQDDVLDVIIAETRRLKNLADDILDASRIESGNLTYNFQRSGINGTIADVLGSARLVASRYSGSDKPVTVETRLQNDVELMIDKTRMTQALTNIVSNSLKFTDKGQVTIETTILAHKNLLEIKVIDTGPGIAKEILPKLFGKFVTKTSGDHANKRGTGLGLFITKSIIQAHGGDIFAYNNEGGTGATFVIRLPIAEGSPAG